MKPAPLSLHTGACLKDMEVALEAEKKALCTCGASAPEAPKPIFPKNLPDAAPEGPYKLDKHEAFVVLNTFDGEKPDIGDSLAMLNPLKPGAGPLLALSWEMAQAIEEAALQWSKHGETYSEGARWYCVFCHQQAEDNLEEWNMRPIFPHAPDCPVLRARAAVQGTAEGAP